MILGLLRVTLGSVERSHLKSAIYEPGAVPTDLEEELPLEVCHDNAMVIAVSDEQSPVLDIALNFSCAHSSSAVPATVPRCCMFARSTFCR